MSEINYVYACGCQASGDLVGNHCPLHGDPIVEEQRQWPLPPPRRLYLAGPMSGLPEYNFPAFHSAAAALRAAGWTVENPAENPVPPCGGTWAGYMRQALRQMLTCEAVALLPGWEHSRGATIERRLAEDLGIEVHLVGDLVL